MLDKKIFSNDKKLEKYLNRVDDVYRNSRQNLIKKFYCPYCLIGYSSLNYVRNHIEVGYCSKIVEKIDMRLKEIGKKTIEYLRGKYNKERYVDRCRIVEREKFRDGEELDCKERIFREIREIISWRKNRESKLIEYECRMSGPMFLENSSIWIEDRELRNSVLGNKWSKKGYRLRKTNKIIENKGENLLDKLINTNEGVRNELRDTSPWDDPFFLGEEYITSPSPIDLLRSNNSTTSSPINDGKYLIISYILLPSHILIYL